MVQNLKKVLKSKISKFFSFLRHEVPFKAKYNRKAVVVCAIHVVKRPSKRSVLVYTIKTQLKYVCVCVRIYMFVCSELIEETGRPPGLIFGMWRYFWPGSDKFEFWKKFHIFDEVMT